MVSRMLQVAFGIIAMAGCTKLDGHSTSTKPNFQYVGELKDGVANGTGTATYADGLEYVGQFMNGEPSGHGTLTMRVGGATGSAPRPGLWPAFHPGDQYVGEFKDGGLSGQGTLKSMSGETYVGEWKNGKPNGQGTETYDRLNYDANVAPRTRERGIKTDVSTGEWMDGKLVKGTETLTGDKGPYRRLEVVDGSKKWFDISPDGSETETP